MLALGLAVLPACEEPRDAPDDEAYDPLVAFDTGAVAIETPADTFRVPVELAVTDEQRAYGLMERPSLPAERGMLFLYPEARDSTGSFWMFRTRVPLDIAFVDDDGLILDIQAMDPCESPNPLVCRRYGPGVPFAAALEVNRGFFDRHGVRVGDRIRLRE